MAFAITEDHLLLTRVVTQPNVAESFSIYNPTNMVIDLTNYYICDNEDYYMIHTENDVNPSSTISGYTAQFPTINIEPHDTFTIVLHEDYKSFYGETFVADLVMFGDSDSSLTGSIGFSGNKINEHSELLVLFYWDKNNILPIQDVDYFLWGSYQTPINKTGVANYKTDTPNDSQLYFEEKADSYYAYSRIDIDELDEHDANGNGITGHDETSENFRNSWEILPLFNLGCTSDEAINYDAISEIDNGSCYYTTISEIVNNPTIGEEVLTAGIISDYYKPENGPHIVSIAENLNGFIIELSIWDSDWTSELQQMFEETPFFTHEIKVVGIVGEYGTKLQITPSSIQLLNNQFEFQAPEVSINSILKGNHNDQIIMCEGLLVDYFDVTVYNGPHALTIENSHGYRVELSIWPNTYDISISSNAYLLQPPYGQYYLSVMGSVGEYENEKQLSISGSKSITVSDTINTEGFFIEDDSASVQISPAPFVLLPSFGETLDFSYSFPNKSRVIIRIYDLSGRFITSLIDKYFSNAGSVIREENSSAWDGRDQLGQIVLPGTYIMHMEVMNPVTGKTQIDAAPIVVGVKN